MRCPACNNNLPDDALFCNICGARVKKPEVKQPVKKPQNTARSSTAGKSQGINLFTVIIVILIVLAVGLAGTITYLFAAGSNKKYNSHPAISSGGGGGFMAPAPATEAPTEPPTEAPTERPNESHDDRPDKPPADGRGYEDGEHDGRPDKGKSIGYINDDPAPDEYIYPQNRYLTHSELDAYYSKNGEEKTRETVRLMINEIYADNGYIFTTDKYAEYFNRKTWYMGIYTNQEDAKARMDEIASANLKLLYDYEIEHNWR
ncbi:MAG: YARHG domain-containing protein [Candidatus Ornithomonoglobus sp.]